MSQASDSQNRIKRTALLIGTFHEKPLGFHSVCEDLARKLTASGWIIFTASSQTNKLARLIDMICAGWKYRSEYSVAHIDVFSYNAFLWAELMGNLCRLERKPFVLTLHGGNLPVFAQQWPGRIRSLLRSAAIVTTPSLFLFEHMKPYCETLKLIPNPIDIDNYSFQIRSKARPRLVWLRSFHHLYNPTIAPVVVANLRDEFPEIQLTMIGPDKGDGSLQKTQHISVALDIEAKVEFLGGIPKDKVPSTLNSGDIFLNTTNADNTPISVIEAMACGLCIVSTNVGGIPYLLEHERDALLVPPNDPYAMAQAVRRIVEGPELAQHLSQNARAKAEQFDWSFILPQWEEVFISSIEAHR